jgi:putative intracellular protease/amidase
MSELNKIAAVLFDGFELLDVFGPLEAFGILSYEKAYEVVTVAQYPGAVTSAQGPKTVPDSFSTIALASICFSCPAESARVARSITIRCCGG